MDEPAASGPSFRDRLQEALRRLASDDLEHRMAPGPDGPDREVAEALNRMAESLQSRREEIVRAVEFYCLRRFGSVLVHDLKNLAARLHFVPGNLRSSEDDPEVVEACAATVEDTASRLLQLVRRFRDQREAMVLRIEGDLNGVVEAAVEQSGIREMEGFDLRLDLGELPRTVVDAAYLEEAFTNLLRNAVEAMPEGGIVRVETRRTGEESTPMAEIRFSDQGCGMTAEFIERELFEPFRSTKGRGMGLGMFSCRETIQLHGGRIDVESEPGSGTSFRVRLPIRSLQEEGPTPR